MFTSEQVQGVKQTVTFTIEGRLDGLNEYTKACRSNRYVGAAMKERNENYIKYNAYKEHTGSVPLKNIKFTKRVRLYFKWIEKNMKRDMDNIAFAKKFILDALVSMGVLTGDSWKYVAGFSDDFDIDKDNPRIEVTICEVE